MKPQMEYVEPLHNREVKMLREVDGTFGLKDTLVAQPPP